MRVIISVLPAGYFFNRGQNHLVRKTMVDLVVHDIEFAHIRPFIMVLILKDVFKVYFTARLNSTAVENHLVRKVMVDLVVRHIEFAHIPPLNMVLI